MDAPPIGLLRHLRGRQRNRIARLVHYNQGVNQGHDEAVKNEIRSQRIQIDGDVLSYCPEDGENKVGVYVAAAPLGAESNYFEVTILETGITGTIAVGLVPGRYPLDKQPGWRADSVAYHADDGKIYKAKSQGRPFGPKCYAGDTIGCGIRIENAVRQMVPVFFTRNGKEIGTVLAPMPLSGLFPAVGMHSDGEEVDLNLDARWDMSGVNSMSIDTCEEDWARLHDVRINGQVLEYTGHGKSIIDVGLAQAKSPLDPCKHYFEMEIIDPGENCYIAIGLARRDYPKHRHPGWNKGSIAYHADDGKIFIGSGLGEGFGPKCIKGDIVGCGIMFPRDYNYDADSDGSRAESPDFITDDDVIENEEYVLSSESEDNEWWEHSNNESDRKVQIFFTRNGKIIGKRELCIPKGGFYPTVGMLSSDEKIRVDLRPLTG